MPYKGTQPNHYVTDSNNNTKVGKYNDNAPMSDADKKALLNEIDKIISDSRIKAKQELDKRKSPKTNWITKL